MHDNELLGAIGAIYETAFSSQRWQPVLDRVADITGGNGAMLLVRNPEPSELQIASMSSRYKVPDAELYVNSLRTGEELRWIQALDALPPRTVLRDIDVWPDAHTYDAIPSVQFLKTMDLYHRCAARLCTHGGWQDALAVLYNANRDGVRAEEAERLLKLLPHVARAIEVQRPFVLLERRYRAVLSALDRLGIGVAVLREDGAMLITNTEAERIFDADDGLGRDRRGALSATGNQRAELAAAVRRTAGGASLATGSEGGAVTISRRSGLDSYVVDLVPVHDAEVMQGPGTGALALLVDPDHRAMVSTDGLARSYDLTAAEGDVCRLITQGLTAREIADDRSVTLSTIKSQTRAIFEKTRTRNRSELIRRALSILPPIVDTDGHRLN